MSLREFHGYRASVRWRLVSGGVEVEESGVERSRGTPVTATRVWDAYAADINRVARECRVPCHLVVATICTESAGNADAVRREPGYVSDEKTPGRISAGLMQTLISTARETLSMSLGRDFLLDPGGSILAGTSYIAKQAPITGLDPPLVAAAYNAGRLTPNDGVENRWKLLQYPIGTGKHVDRFVRFFNDAVAVLSTHATAPAVGLDALLGEGPAPAPPTPIATTPARDSISIEFAPTARGEVVSAYSRQVLEDVLRLSSLRRALVTSTSRTPEEQARAMYNNLESEGVASQRDLYRHRGGKYVIDVYERSKADGKTRAAIVADMTEKIREVGPTRVSRHASDPKELNVFDVAPSSIADHVTFEKRAKSDRRISLFLTPPLDPAYHLEIPQPTA